MSTLKNIHGGGTGPVNDEEDKDVKPKPGGDLTSEAADFFERVDRHRPRKPRVITSFSRR